MSEIFFPQNFDFAEEIFEFCLFLTQISVKQRLTKDNLKSQLTTDVSVIFFCGKNLLRPL